MGTAEHVSGIGKGGGFQRGGQQWDSGSATGFQQGESEATLDKAGGGWYCDT